MINKVSDISYLGCRAHKIMTAEPTLNQDNLNLFCHFITERQNIYNRRFVLEEPRPWTSDKILRDNRFTNVKRYLDKTTMWLLANVTHDNNISYRDKVYLTIMFRLYNKIETGRLLNIGKDFSWNKDEIRSIVSAARESDNEISFYTGVYRVPKIKQGMKIKYPNEDLNAGIALMITEERNKDVGDSKYDIIMDPATNALDICNFFEEEIYGVSSFISYQLFVDLTYIDEFHVSENEFVLAGPGCKHGMDELFISRDGMTYEEAIFWLRDNQDSFIDKSTREVLFLSLPSHDRNLTVMDIENCFCEFSKYMKIKRAMIDGTHARKRRFSR